MSDTIEQKCLSKGVKLTDQRKVIAKVISESKAEYGESDHPDVDELYSRVSKIDYYCYSFQDFIGVEKIRYENIPILCDKFEIKKNLINPIYIS